MEAHLGPCVDVVDEPLEELNPVLLTVVDGVISLASQDGQKLRAGLEEAASFADRFEGSIEAGRAGAVTIAQEAGMPGDDPAHVGPFEAEW